MFSKLFLYFIIFKLSSAQLNGEFWWLTDKVKQLKGIEPPLPQFEELSEFDTDETSKIIFRDQKVLKDVINVDNNKNTEESIKQSSSEDTGRIVWPDSMAKPSKRHQKATTLLKVEKPEQIKKFTTDRKPTGNDLFTFIFPDDYSVMKTKRQETVNKSRDGKVQSLEPTNVANEVTKLIPVTENHYKDLIVFKYSDQSRGIKNNERPIKNQPETIKPTQNNAHSEKFTEDKLSQNNHSSTENICTYMKKSKCYERNGSIYKFKL
jgi:hypothetical protein